MEVGYDLLVFHNVLWQRAGFGEELRSERWQLAAIEVAAPTALPVVGRKGHVRRSRSWPIFANSRGEVSAYDASGALQWQVCHLFAPPPPLTSVPPLLVGNLRRCCMLWGK